jgi:hypothetical protein
MCHCYTSISLDREELSRSHALPADIVARYDELAERSWIHTSRGGSLRLYTRSTSQKPRNQNNIVHLTKIRKNECMWHASIISLLDLSVHGTCITTTGSPPAIQKTNFSLWRSDTLWLVSSYC